MDEYKINKEPKYTSIGNEVSVFDAAISQNLPIMLKGPTGCGKTRFVEHMAWKLKMPLVTVSCHEDMTASDLVGRYLLGADGTYWQDGPLTLAVRSGAICYLDEVVEARQDTTVIIHSLTDDRRILPLEKKGELVRAHSNFNLVISYNPGYQSVIKDLKESTKQRFCALEFSYPNKTLECEILLAETGIDKKTAEKLVNVAEKSRNLKGNGLSEGLSTRMLVHASRLIQQGLDFQEAGTIALVNPMTDDNDVKAALQTAIELCC